MDYTALESQPACQPVSTAQQLWRQLCPLGACARCWPFFEVLFIFYVCQIERMISLPPPSPSPPPTAYCQWDPVRLCPDCTPPLPRTFHGSLSE